LPKKGGEKRGERGKQKGGDSSATLPYGEKGKKGEKKRGERKRGKGSGSCLKPSFSRKGKKKKERGTR